LLVARGVESQGWSPRGRGAAGAGDVADDRHQPGAQRGAGAKGAEGAVGANEGLLGRVVCLLGRADDEVGHAKGKLLVAAHELIERGGIATSRALDQLRFPLVQWMAPYGRDLTLVLGPDVIGSRRTLG